MAPHSGVVPATGYLQWQARTSLGKAFGPGPEAAWGLAPGRCTLVGEHVDYAGGLVLCAAIDLHVAVAVRPSRDRADRSFFRGREVSAGAAALQPAGAGYIFAAARALRGGGVDVPPFEAMTSASVPQGAGLASSAAVVCATLVALLRQRGAQMTARAVIDAAYAAEHDILGVPCGRLDQHAVVESPAHGALLLDSAADTVSTVPWELTDAALVVCDTGERHSVAGPEYARRRAETAAALEQAGMETAQQPVPDALRDDATSAPGPASALHRRLRHVTTESRRAAAAADALRAGDAAALGRLMSASHRSLRDDHEVSTPGLDAAVAAAEATPGCYGARMVGAGFGGSVLALTTAAAARACIDAMRSATGGAGRGWVLRPSPGVALTAGDAVSPG